MIRENLGKVGRPASPFFSIAGNMTGPTLPGDDDDPFVPHTRYFLFGISYVSELVQLRRRMSGSDVTHDDLLGQCFL